MSDNYEKLWQSLLRELEKNGDLPLHYTTMTADEIARNIRLNRQDDRPWRFIQDYYYPRSYGQEQGALTDEEAIALIVSYQRGKSIVTPASLTSNAQVTQQHNCEICGTRRERGHLH